MQERQTKRGVKTKLFGVILILLATLNSMLSWRGGFVANDYYVLLFAAGIFLYAVGAIRQRRQEWTDQRLRDALKPRSDLDETAPNPPEPPR